MREFVTARVKIGFKLVTSVSVVRQLLGSLLVYIYRFVLGLSN